MATDKDQLEEKYALLVDNIIEPMATGQVYEIEISPPVSFSDWPYMQNYVERLNRLKISERDAIVFKMTIRLDKDFKENMLNTLENIADRKEKVKENTCKKKDYGYCIGAEAYGVSEDVLSKSFRVGVYDKTSKVTDIYLMKDIKSVSYEVWRSGRLVKTKPYAWITGNQMYEMNHRISRYGKPTKDMKPMSHLSVNFLNRLGSIISAIELTTQFSWEEESIGFSLISANLSGFMDRDNKKRLFETAVTGQLLNNLKSSGSTGDNQYIYLSDITVFDELTYWLILKLDQETIRNAKSVVVEMVE